MDKDFEWVLEEIAKLPPDWHDFGSLSPKALRTIARYAEQIGTIHNSVETGLGKSPPMFSHVSRNHTVFAVDNGGSISQVKWSNIFNEKTVTFAEGPP
jgi:hypothetical protein